MQHESKQIKPNKREGAAHHGGEASVTARACKSLLNPRANAALSARLAGAVGVVDGTAPAWTHHGMRRAPVMANRCRSLLIAQFGAGLGVLACPRRQRCRSKRSHPEP